MSRTGTVRLALLVVSLVAATYSIIVGAGAGSGAVGHPRQVGAAPVVAQPTNPSGSVTGSPDARAPAPAQQDSASTRPVRVQIPAIGVDSGLQALGITSDGSLASPSEWQRAGWYSGGVQPGDVGPAVIAGHVDSREGPAVFYRLRSLRPGDQVTITRADRRRLVFVVDGMQRYPKKSFPTEAVYGPTSMPLLRLVTCTGDFDAKARSYLDNLVVTSHLVTP